MTHSKKFQFINSRFTRKQGYTNIQSSKKIEPQKAIELLNSFTPQGASPKISLRIGAWNNYLGAGYYFMENQEDAVISTILMKTERMNSSRFDLPLSSTAIQQIASGNHQWLLKREQIDPINISEKFGIDQASMILYSLLAGDNIIIIHPLHETRIRFIKSLLELMPIVYFNYNRITTGCAEMDGNENIIGVENLPPSYRSHKKLYMPLDTIFVDLNQDTVMGEGLKTNDFTHKISETYIHSTKKAKTKIQGYFNDVSTVSFSNHSKYGDNSKSLTTKLRGKLGLEQENSTDWIMTF